MFKTLRVEEESLLQGLVGCWRDGTTPVSLQVHWPLAACKKRSTVVMGDAWHMHMEVQWSPHDAEVHCGQTLLRRREAYRSLCDAELTGDAWEWIRHGTPSGTPRGKERCKAQSEKIVCRKVGGEKHGWPPRLAFSTGLHTQLMSRDRSARLSQHPVVFFVVCVGGVSNADIDGNNALHIKGIGTSISTFWTLPEKRQCDGKPVLSAPTIPREREYSLPCTILSGGESRIRRRGYAIVAARSRLCQAERGRGDRVV